jgi:uncharacterized membrane protein SirB2
MDYVTLKVVHVTAIALTFIGLTGILALKLAGGAPAGKRMIFHVAYGVGMVTLIVTGFALAGKLGLHGAPPWLMGKFVIWLLAGGSMVLANRFYRFAGPIVIFFVLLVGTAAWLALVKP